MIMEGAGVCPLIKIGDEVKGREVIDIVCDKNTAGSCSAFRSLALLQLEHPDKEWYFFAPFRVVDCNTCPVLADDPDHLSKTKSPIELIREAMVRGDRLTSEHEHVEPRPPDHKPKGRKHEHGEHDRFELIDMEEGSSDEESSSDPNKQ